MVARFLSCQGLDPNSLDGALRHALWHHRIEDPELAAVLHQVIGGRPSRAGIAPVPGSGAWLFVSSSGPSDGWCW